MLLVTHGHPTLIRHRHPNLGRLVQPRHFSSIEDTAHAGIPWAADNDCFQGLDEPAFRRMLDVLEGLPGCLFVVAPDVVGDTPATLTRFYQWQPELAARGFPVALALQDGMTIGNAPWFVADAVFVGGTTDYKLGADAAAIVRAAATVGRWSHMGRVNSARRIRYARSIGCDSIDGSSWTRWEARWMRHGAQLTAAPQQLRMEEL